MGPKFNEKEFSQFNMQMKVTEFHWEKMKINILFSLMKIWCVPFHDWVMARSTGSPTTSSSPSWGTCPCNPGLDGKCSSYRMSSVLQDLLSTGHEQNTSPGRIPGGILTKWPNRSGGSLSSSPYLYASAQPPSGGNLFQLLVFMILPAALSLTQLRELRNSISLNTNL